MRKYGFSLLIVSSWILLSVFFHPEAAQSQPTGVMRGKVINGTKGGPKVSGAEVFLYQIEGEQEKEKERTKTDRAGAFSFRGLRTGSDVSYSVRVLYKGVEYFSPKVSFGDRRELPLSLSVYETTDQEKEIAVKMHHVVVKLEDGDLQVQEMMVLENRGDRVYIGLREVEPQKREVLQFSLPRKATDLGLSKNLMDCCIIATEGGFIDTMDIKPGRKEIAFYYKIKYGSSTYELTKSLHAKTESLNVFLPNNGIKAKSSQLEFKGVVGDQGAQFLHFAGSSLESGSRVEVDLSGLPQGKKFIKWAVTGAGIFLFGVGVSLPFLRKRTRGWEGGKRMLQHRSRSQVLFEEREELLRNIAHMDGLFQSQQVDPGQYRSRRKQMMDRVILLTKQVKRLEGSTGEKGCA
jgi:hypothetical protein